MATDSEVLDNVAEALGVDRTCVDNTTVADDLPEWDSVGAINLLFMLGEKYEIDFPPSAAGDLKSVDAICKVLRDAGKLE